MQNLIATTFEVVHYIALQAVHYKPLQEVHLSRYNQQRYWFRPSSQGRASPEAYTTTEICIYSDAYTPLHLVPFGRYMQLRLDLFDLFSCKHILSLC